MMTSWQFKAHYQAGDFVLDLHCDGGPEPVAIVGPNGAGKSTILRMFCGMIHPTAGRISVQDRVFEDSDEGIRLSPSDRHVGYVPQNAGLFSHMSVLDNVAFGPRARGMNPSDAQEAALQQLRELKCEALAHKRPENLSGGEAQKIALARAMVIDPILLLLDEPMNALDAPTRRQYRQFLKEYLAETACPSIVVTHDVRDVLALDASVIVLDQGAITQHGSVSEMIETPQSPFVSEFFGHLGPHN